jgi:hypothetical protein
LRRLLARVADARKVELTGNVEVVPRFLLRIAIGYATR